MHKIDTLQKLRKLKFSARQWTEQADIAPYFFEDFHFPYTTQLVLLTTRGNRPFEKFVGKGENDGNQQFLLIPQRFLPY